MCWLIPFFILELYCYPKYLFTYKGVRVTMISYGWRDSNPHASRHKILSLACLPIPPHPHIYVPIGIISHILRFDNTFFLKAVVISAQGALMPWWSTVRFLLYSKITFYYSNSSCSGLIRAKDRQNLQPLSSTFEAHFERNCYKHILGKRTKRFYPKCKISW